MPSAKRTYSISRRKALKQMAAGATVAVAAAQTARSEKKSGLTGENMTIVDAHAYVGDGVHMRHSVDNLLRQMDEAKIDLSIICPMDRFTAVANREGNNLILKAVKAHPGRLVGMAVANPWFGKDASQELHRALENGLSGLKIDSVLQGFRLCDHLVDPLLEVAEKHGVPVYAHTGTAGLAEPFHVIELARRFPKINFIMGHAGASDYYNDTVRGLQFVDNVWIESSRNGPGNYCHWQISGVVDRVVFGSSAPEYIPQIELETLRDIFTDPAELKRILAGSIQEVYRGRLPL